MKHQFTNLSSKKYIAEAMLLIWISRFQVNFSKRFCRFCSMTLFFICSMGSVFSQQIQQPISNFSAILRTPVSTNYKNFYTGSGASQLTISFSQAGIQGRKFRLFMKVDGPNDSKEVSTDYEVSTNSVIINKLTPALQDLFDKAFSQKYSSTGELPEGQYTFSFHLEDVNNLGTDISGERMCTANISQNNSPELSKPDDEADLNTTTASNPNISFSWNTDIPYDSRSNIQYRIQFVEENNQNPVWGVIQKDNTGFVNAIIDVSSIRNRSWLYNLRYGQLGNGKKIYWRVQVVDQNGVYSFRNNGWSEWRSFNNNVPKPTLQLTIQKPGTGSCPIKWEVSSLTGTENSSNFQEFLVLVRDHVEPITKFTKWNEAILVDNSKAAVYNPTKGLNATISKLYMGKSYDVKVQAFKDGVMAFESAVCSFTTINPYQAVSQCGQAPKKLSDYVKATDDWAGYEVKNYESEKDKQLDDDKKRTYLQNNNLLVMLGEGELEITNVASKNGSTINGDGVLHTPFLGITRLKVSFIGMQVGADNRVYALTELKVNKTP